MSKTFADFGIDVPNRGGAERYTTCPQCSPRRKKKRVKCLQVNVEKEVWICHHCGWKGGLKSGSDFSQRNKHWNAPKYQKPEPRTRPEWLPDRIIQWFAGRGIPEEVLRRNRIHYGRVYMPQVGAWIYATQFPFYRNGELVNIKFRDDRKNFCMKSGCERILFGLDDVQEECTIIVEGEIDKLSLEAAGFENCVSVPDGAPTPDSKDYSSKFEFLENCKAQLAKVKKFIIAVDNDEPGKRLEQELTHRLGKERCAFARWPDGCKDANETLVKHGIEGLVDCIYAAELAPIEGVITVNDISSRIIHLYENGMEPGLSPGWPNLEKFYRVSPGEWTLVTGIPGHGKSEFLDALLIKLSELHGWSHGIFSPENYPLELHVAKLCEKRGGAAFSNQSGSLAVGLNREQMLAAKSWVHDHFKFIKPNDDMPKLSSVLDMADAMVLRYGIKGLVIDPWNEMDHERPPNLTETEYISKCLSHIRQFARRTNIHVWLVAHPTKLNKLPSGQYPVPSPYDVAGSAHFRNKADNCIAVYRNDKTGLVEIHVQKIRFKKNGRQGVVYMRYDTVCGRYYEAPDPTKSQLYHHPALK